MITNGNLILMGLLVAMLGVNLWLARWLRAFKATLDDMDRRLTALDRDFRT